MALGRCGTCDKLCSILPIARKWESKEADWAPVVHARIVHPGCDRHLDGETDPTKPWICDKCGYRIRGDELLVEHCSGSKKPIK